MNITEVSNTASSYIYLDTKKKDPDYNAKNKTLENKNKID